LNSRQRCIAAIQLEEPDRVPLDIAIEPHTLHTLMEFLGVEHERIERHQDILPWGIGFATSSPRKGTRAIVDPKIEQVYRSLGIDMRHVEIGLQGGYDEWRVDEGLSWKEQDVWGIKTLWGKSLASDGMTHTYRFLEHPLQLVPLEEYHWPGVDSEGQNDIRKFCQKMEDYCICGYVTSLFEMAWQLIGFQYLLVKMHRDPKLVEEILDHLDEIRTEQALLLAEAGVDVIITGEDVGMQRGMMISPSLFKHFLKPHYERWIRKVKSRHDVFIMYHSDGWIEPIIPDLIDVGVDILNPVQPECMDPTKLKDLYGDKLCFHGTIGVQSTLPFGTVEDVVQEVNKRIRSMGDTGLILAPTHAIQADVSPEKIIAMYETARRYGRSTVLST